MLCRHDHPLPVLPEQHTAAEGVPGTPVQATDTWPVPEAVPGIPVQEPGQQGRVPGGHPRSLHHSSRRTSHQVRAVYHRNGSSTYQKAVPQVQLRRAILRQVTLRRNGRTSARSLHFYRIQGRTA